MATAQQKVDAAGRAFTDLEGKNQPLAQKLFADWVGAGFQLSAGVAGDLASVTAVSPSDAAAISAMMTDKAATAIVVKAGLGPIATGIGNAIGGAASKTVVPAANMALPAVFSGLHDFTNLTIPGAILGTLAGALTDGKMWRSLGWIVGGLLLLLMGLALWVKGSLNPLKALR